MNARRAGPLAAQALMGDRRGFVVSVHERAVNLLLDDDALVALLPGRTPLHPWAVAAPVARRDLEQVAEGAPVRVRDGAIEAGTLRVELAGLEVVDLRLRHRLRAVAPAARALARRLPAARPTGPFEPALRSALERFRAGGEAAALAGLVGLGEGLTPSGDDALVGVLAGLDAAREASADAVGLRDGLRAALEDGALRTTRLAAQMVDAAIVGLYAEPVLDLFATLAQPRPGAAALDRAVAALLAVGHRSGADTLHGIAAALARLADAAPRPGRAPRNRPGGAARRAAK